MTNRNTGTFLVVALAGVACLALAVPARALSGTVSGCMFYRDVRQQGSSLSGSRHLPTGVVGVDRPLMSARVVLLGGGGGAVGTGVTNSSGCYSFSWNDPLLLWWPTSGYKIRVELRDPSDFYVSNELDALFTASSSVVLDNSIEALGNRSFGSVDAAQVFGTASEYWQRIVDNSAHLSNRMTNVHIRATVPEGWLGCAESCSWGATDVYIADGAGQTEPVSSVAHEIGHATHFSALEVDHSSMDLACLEPHFFTSTETCEAWSFNEGVADFWAAVFSWSNNATEANIDAENGGFTEGSIETPEPVCIASATPERIQGCVAAMLWDVYDDPTGDDDGINDSQTAVGVNTISNIFQEYNDNCISGFDNRCSNEGGLHGVNHWDFLFNLNDEIPSFLDEARGIYAGIDFDENCPGGCGEEPFSF